MRLAFLLRGTLVVALFAAPVAFADGCAPTLSDCTIANTCDCPSPDFCPGTGGSAGNGGGGGGVNPSCIPSALPANTALPDTCTGAFVSGTNGSDVTGDGTRGAPYASLTKAIAESAPVIYVCAEATADTATVTVPPGTSIFGAIDCATYRYAAATKSTLNPGTTIALVLAPGAGARIEDMHIESATATNLGDSSIAVVANATTSAALTRVELVAGAGANGTDGVGLPDDSNLDGQNGGPGNNDATVCPPVGGATSLPGSGHVKTCDGIVVSGGDGGIGTTGPGNSDGGPGNPTAGLGGPAGIGSAPDCTLGAGHGGTSATPAPDGVGATGLGTLTAAGYSAPLATAGTHGDPGGGGGGGRGAGCTAGTTGPSGGGGASGGCGGAGGGLGGAAGASIALALVDATVTVTDAALTTATGGTGGSGGTGQNGGVGGFSGGIAGGSGACNGGPGGNGGRGGNGGGGAGGPTVGVGKTGTSTLNETGVTYTLGTPGPGGAGGGGNGALNGAAGIACETLDFVTTNCTNG